MRGLVGVLIALALGCQIDPKDEVDEVATQLCGCFSPGDPKCVAQLEQTLGPQVSTDCSKCVFDNERTCARMVDDCLNLCIRQVGGL